MKKYSNIIFVVFLIIFAAGLWLFNSNITRVPLLSDDNFNFVKGKVVEITEDNTTDKEVNGGSQNVKVKITSGKYKGKIMQTNVNIRASIDLSPRFPPTRNNANPSIPTIIQIKFPLSYPYILPDNWSP